MAKGVFNPIVPTEDDIYLGEGIYYKNYGEVDEEVIGATRGGSKLEIDKVIREMNYDGAFGPVRDLRRYERYVPRFNYNLLKMNHESLLYGLPADYSDQGDYYEITFRLNIELTDYMTNMAFVGKNQAGKALIIIIYNVLNDGNISLEFKEKDELFSEMQMTGHYPSDDALDVPIDIRHYDVAA